MATKSKTEVKAPATGAESPFALSTYVKHPYGWQLLVTLRAGSAGELLSNFAQLEAVFLDEGYEPLREGRFQVVAPAPEARTPSDREVCPIHKTPFSQMASKSGGFYWSCHNRMPDGTWCKEKPSQ